MMLRTFLCMSAGLAFASAAIANPTPVHELKPLRDVYVTIGGDPGAGVSEIRYVYDAASDFAWGYAYWSAYYMTSGGQEVWTEWADDLHLDAIGDYLGGQLIYQPNGTGGPDDVMDLILAFWENDELNELWPSIDTNFINVFFDDVPADSAFAWRITYTLAEPFVWDFEHVWAGVYFWSVFDPGTGQGTPYPADSGCWLMAEPAPIIGRGDDVFWWSGYAPDGIAEGLYWFGGPPNQAVFSFGLEFDAGASGPCLGLDVSNLVAGSPGRFTVTGDPGQTVGVLYSLRTGTFTIPNPGRLGWCVDLGLRLPADPRSQIVCQGTVNGLGEFVCNVPIPPAARGLTVYFQAAARNTCPDYCSSDVVSRVVGP